MLQSRYREDYKKKDKDVKRGMRNDKKKWRDNLKPHSGEYCSEITFCTHLMCIRMNTGRILKVQFKLIS